MAQPLLLAVYSYAIDVGDHSMCCDFKNLEQREDRRSLIVCVQFNYYIDLWEPIKRAFILVCVCFFFLLGQKSIAISFARTTSTKEWNTKQTKQNSQKDRCRALNTIYMNYSFIWRICFIIQVCTSDRADILRPIHFN